MTSPLARVLSSLVALAIALAYLLWSYTYHGRPHEVPNLIGWAAVVLCVLDLIAQTNTGLGRVLSGLMSGQPLDSSTPSPDAAEPSIGVAIIACAWLVLFVVLVALIGFIAAVPIYMLAFMLIQGRIVWWRSILIAAFVTAVVWLVFEQLLRYQMFEGVLFGGQF